MAAVGKGGSAAGVCSWGDMLCSVVFSQPQANSPVDVVLLVRLSGQCSDLIAKGWKAPQKRGERPSHIMTHRIEIDKGVSP